jgi:hypothetical protein
MAGKLKHKSRSRKTAARRLMAARYYLNYNMTRIGRQMLKAAMMGHYMSNP